MTKISLNTRCEFFTVAAEVLKVKFTRRLIFAEILWNCFQRAYVSNRGCLSTNFPRSKKCWFLTLHFPLYEHCVHLSLMTHYVSTHNRLCDIGSQRKNICVFSSTAYKQLHICTPLGDYLISSHVALNGRIIFDFRLFSVILFITPSLPINLIIIELIAKTSLAASIVVEIEDISNNELWCIFHFFHSQLTDANTSFRDYFAVKAAESEIKIHFSFKENGLDAQLRALRNWSTAVCCLFASAKSIKTN